MVTGTWPPQACGVGDYTHRLCLALADIGIDVRVVHPPAWGLHRLPRILSLIDQVRPDLIHLQYPTIRYGASIVPQAIMSVRPGVVTIHEASQARLPRQVSLLPYTVRARALIFTNPFEETFARRWAPWLPRCSQVIPLASNIPFYDRAKDLPEVVHFGLIRPQKGLEGVIALAHRLGKAGQPGVRIVGTPDPRHLDYFAALRASAEGAPVIWDSGLSAEGVGEVLARSQVGYLPFPDGASERRTTLIALVGNGVATVTTRGPHTPTALDGAVAWGSDLDAVATAVQRLRADHAYRAGLASAGRTWAAAFQWGDIARRHLALYRRLRDPAHRC